MFVADYFGLVLSAVIIQIGSDYEVKTVFTLLVTAALFLRRVVITGQVMVGSGYVRR